MINTYKVTEEFPGRETYSLVDQMRRAAISITSNIAEGFNRHSNKEKIQFYYLALGSLTELQNQLLVAKDVGYLPKEKFETLAQQTVELTKILNGLIKSIKNFGK